jgi:acetyl-CoA acetyltransferase
MGQSYVFLHAATRSLMRSYRGALNDLPALEPGRAVINETLSRAKISGRQTDAVVMGQVVQAWPP